jgi:hypothetical protein
MRALSIRQPYAELILRGVKRIEYRSRATRIVGERFWIYAAKRPFDKLGTAGDAARRIWSNDLAVPGPKRGEPPGWMMELAEELILGQLPSGVIVGSAVIERCVPALLPTPYSPPPTLYEWHLANVRRSARLRKPAGHPQPVWFKPF